MKMTITPVVENKYFKDLPDFEQFDWSSSNKWMKVPEFYDISKNRKNCVNLDTKRYGYINDNHIMEFKPKMVKVCDLRMGDVCIYNGQFCVVCKYISIGTVELAALNTNDTFRVEDYHTVQVCEIKFE